MRMLRHLKTGLFAALALGLIFAGQPQEAKAQLTPLAAGPYKNLLVCGDFGVCPWQAGTSNVGGDIAATAVYTADQWVCFGNASSAINVSRITTAANLPAATQAAFKMQRKSANANAGAITCAQIIETANTIPLQGKTLSAQLALSAGANWSATTGVTVAFITGTGTNEGSASLAAATWTGQATASTTNIPTASILTTAPTQFFSGASGGPFNNLTFTVPAAATELAIEITWTPVGTAGANDWIALANPQLEVGNTITGFERRTVQQELTLAQRYFWQWAETVSSTAASPFMCSAQSTTVAVCKTMLHTPMFKTPTVTCAFGTMKRMVAGTDTALSACAAAATTNGVSDLDSVSITATVAAGDTAGFSGSLMSGNSTGGGLVTVAAQP